MIGEKDNNKKPGGGINPVAVAVSGAVVGAGVAVAGTVALQSKENRQKVKKALTSLKDKAMDYMEDVRQQVAKNNDLTDLVKQGKPKVSRKKSLEKKK